MKGKKVKVNREFKDGVFRTLFNDKEKMLELYNAVSDEPMGDEALENIDNGVATICDSRLMGLLMQPVHQRKLAMNRLQIRRRVPTLRSNSLRSLLSVLPNQA